MKKSRSPEISLSSDPSSATEDVAKLRLELRDRSLSELEKEELVYCDREKHLVTKGPKFYEKWAEYEIG